MTCAIIFPLVIVSPFLDTSSDLLRSVAFVRTFLFGCFIFFWPFVLCSLANTLIDLPLCKFVNFKGRLFFVLKPLSLLFDFWINFATLYNPLPWLTLLVLSKELLIFGGFLFSLLTFFLKSLMFFFKASKFTSKRLELLVLAEGLPLLFLSIIFLIFSIFSVSSSLRSLPLVIFFAPTSTN